MVVHGETSVQGDQLGSIEREQKERAERVAVL